MTLFAEPAPPPTRRWPADVLQALGVVVGMVLLGAPVGLLWSAVSPRVEFEVSDQGVNVLGPETSEGFIGADGSYVLVLFAAGLVCGLLAWWLARRSGPWAVVGLAVGGVLAALVAARVGLLPGKEEALAALQPGSQERGTFELYLGTREEGSDDLHLRAAWGAVAWPVGALVAFLGCALAQTDDLT